MAEKVLGQYSTEKIYVRARALHFPRTNSIPSMESLGPRTCLQTAQIQLESKTSDTSQMNNLSHHNHYQ